MKVNEIMDKNLPCLHPDDSIQHAINLFVKLPYGGLPVTDRRGKLLGELSQRELLLIDIGRKEFSDEFVSSEQIRYLTAKSAKIVKDLMNRHEFTIATDEDVLLAAKILYDNDITTLPVIDNKGKLRGVITDVCILKHYKRLLKA